MVKSGIIDPAKVTRSAVEKRGQHRGDDPDHRCADHRHPGEDSASAMPPGGGEF